MIDHPIEPGREFRAARVVYDTLRRCDSMPLDDLVGAAAYGRRTVIKGIRELVSKVAHLGDVIRIAGPRGLGPEGRRRATRRDGRRSLKPYARRRQRFQNGLVRRAHDLAPTCQTYAEFDDAVHEAARAMNVHGLAPKDWRAVIAWVIDAVWDGPGPDDEVTVEQAAFFAELRAADG